MRSTLKSNIKPPSHYKAASGISFNSNPVNFNESNASQRNIPSSTNNLSVSQQTQNGKGNGNGNELNTNKNMNTNSMNANPKLMKLQQKQIPSLRPKMSSIINSSSTSTMTTTTTTTTTKVPQKKLTSLGTFTAQRPKLVSTLPIAVNNKQSMNHSNDSHHSNNSNISNSINAMDGVNGRTVSIDEKVNEMERKQQSKDLSESTKMDVDSDHSGDSDLEEDDLAPNNLMAPGAKSLVKMKMEENRKRREDAKLKPKVDALHQAKLAREREQRDQAEKKKKKEDIRRRIEENKRKRKREEQERERERDRKRPKLQNKGPKVNGNGKPKKMNQTRRTLVGKENKSQTHGLKKGMKPKRVAVVRKPLNVIDQGQNTRKPLTVNNAGSSTTRKDSKESVVKKENAVKKEKEEVVEYPISDYDSDFSDSDMDEDQCEKPIPQWARKGQPGKRVVRQKAIDPDTIFGRMDYKTCDLEILFKDYPSRTKYRSRSASGDWSKDLMTWTEEHQYKKDMGWI